MRKTHHSIEALLVQDEGAGILVEFRVDFAPVYRRTYPTLEVAIGEANATLREFQLAGWATHW